MQKGGLGRRGEREYYERRISVRSSWTRVGIREGGGTGYARGTPRGMKNRCGGAGCARNHDGRYPHEMAVPL